ncbi:MAG: HAD-IA family hydrolase [Terriglobales bacterium]
MIRFLRQFDPHSIRLLVFDLDGTLIDSRLDLIHSVNATLRHFERPELPGDLIASYIGDGAPILIRRALGDFGTDPTPSQASSASASSNPFRQNASPPLDSDLFTSALEFFLAYYKVHKLDHTIVYDGIPKVLAALADGSCAPDTPALPVGQRKMAVLTNKPVNPSRAIVDALGMGKYFIRVYGGNSFPTKKPDPLGVRTLLQETGVAPEQALMIGDSSVDVQTGRNAGLWTCGVTYGFAPQTLEQVPPDVLVEHPSDLGELLG